VTPFVIQLLSEYIIEIDYEIEKHLNITNRRLYTEFALKNPSFLKLCRERIVTYWSMYYTQIPFSEYPAYRVLSSIGLWNGREGRRLLSKRT
jgi:hypothetical protein